MKKLLAFVLSFVLLFAFACPVTASEDQVPYNIMVVDMADLLTDGEEMELTGKAWELTLNYDCAVYIVTVESLNGWEPWEYNEEIHRQYGMGYGTEQSCIILLLSTEYRDYDIMAHGYGNYAFTDYGKDVMADRFLDEFGDDDWYGGFSEYLSCCKEYLELAAKGEPFDVGSDKNPVVGLAVGIIIPCLTAFIVCNHFKKQMFTANKQTMAGSYMTAEGLALSKRTDLYTHTTRSERYIEEESDGGTTVNSNGSSHKSGKF